MMQPTAAAFDRPSCLLLKWCDDARPAAPRPPPGGGRNQSRLRCQATLPDIEEELCGDFEPHLTEQRVQEESDAAALEGVIVPDVDHQHTFHQQSEQPIESKQSRERQEEKSRSREESRKELNESREDDDEDNNHDDDDDKDDKDDKIDDAHHAEDRRRCNSQGCSEQGKRSEEGSMTSAHSFTDEVDATLEGVVLPVDNAALEGVVAPTTSTTQIETSTIEKEVVSPPAPAESSEASRMRPLTRNDLAPTPTEEERRKARERYKQVEKLLELRRINARVNLLRYRVEIMKGDRYAEDALLELEKKVKGPDNSFGLRMAKGQADERTPTGTGMSRPLLAEDDHLFPEPQPYAPPTLGGTTRHCSRQPIMTEAQRNEYARQLNADDCSELSLEENEPTGDNGSQTLVGQVEEACEAAIRKQVKRQLNGMETLHAQLHRLSEQAAGTTEELLELYEAMQKQVLDTRDEVTRTLEEGVKKPLLNPLCTSESGPSLEGISLANGAQVSAGMIYINTTASELEALSKAELALEGCLKEHVMAVQRSMGKGSSRRYQSMEANLQVGMAGGFAKTIRAVVDSGAAWSAIGRKTLEEKYPNALATLVASDVMRFVDAQGRGMPVAGKVRMHICAGDHCFWTDVYVFETLGVEFLLGVNSLVDGELVIDAKNERLFSLDAPSGAIQVSCARGGHKLGVCTCCSTGQTTVAVDRTACTVSFGSTVLRCDEVSSEEPIDCMKPRPDAVELRAARDLLFPAFQPGDGRNAIISIPAQFQSWVAGKEVGLHIQPAVTLATYGITTHDTRHSSRNGACFLQGAHRSPKEIVIPRGTLLGHAYPQEDATGDRILLAAELESLEELQKKPYKEGGPPVTDEDFEDLGLDLTMCVDAGKRRSDGTYEPLGEKWVKRLKKIATRWWMVWARDARAPRISRLVVIDIPTGDAAPVTQKPYPIPQRYQEAVRKEIQKLLDAGLIEPGIGNWASPTLLTVKKDSTTDELKIKIVVDYRVLNSCTQLDAGGLGNQEDILRNLGGRQKYMGIADLAGGFYEFCLSKSSRVKSAFILPTNMGGTLYQWVVAPYGLARNPSSFSRGVMFALQGMAELNIGVMGSSRGGVHSWVDDIVFHADSLDGYMDLFERILERLCWAGLSLKASKCELLREQMEVLGFIAHPDGLKMNPKKVGNIQKVVTPSNPQEVLTFLGMVNFYRRFVPRMGLLAKPLTDMLKKGGKFDPNACEQACQAIKNYLGSADVLSVPIFDDPLAEFVMCTDASDVAVGGVLMQWQWPHASDAGKFPPEGTPMRGGKGGDPLNQSWRLAAGWELKTIGFYSKTLDETQSKYNVFDKEGGAILLCMRHWADMVTGFPVTVYTDSVVAASMLTKYKGTTRLQRWGLELMSFLPHLKIGYRQGDLNGCADLLSRYPYFNKYVRKKEDEVTLPDDLFDLVAEAQFNLDRCPSVRLGLQLGDTGKGIGVYARVRPMRNSFRLYEPRLRLRGGNGPVPSEIWQDGIPTQIYNIMVADAIGALKDDDKRPNLNALKSLAGGAVFQKEQLEFESQMHTWERYVQTFSATVGRMPVVYDLFCGEGGFSRGARASGLKCYGFDSNPDFKLNYETDPVVTQEGHPTRMSSGMKFTVCDLDGDEFWDELMQRGRIGDLPPPDIIHGSPPCNCFSKLNEFVPGQNSDDEVGKKRVTKLIRRLKMFELQSRRSVPWQLENVPESREYVEWLDGADYVLLCGTMMGHYVFRERVFYCNYGPEVKLTHDHKGKRVGHRGMRLRGSLFGSGGFIEGEPESTGNTGANMWGVYSRRLESRGSYDDWHDALGHTPGTFSRKGISGVLPVGYGRYLASQMVACVLHDRYGTPVFSPKSISTEQNEMLDLWAVEGYKQGNCVPARRDAPAGVLLSRILPLMAGEIDDGVNRSPFDITFEDQRVDPVLRRKIEDLEALGDERPDRGYILRAGHLFYKDEDSLGYDRFRLCVPEGMKLELMHFYHFTMLTGHRAKALYPDIAKRFHWEKMQRDCLDFVSKCQHCKERAVGTRATQVPMGEVPMPSQPFKQIHIDFKGPLRESGGYRYILVVVDAFTRYTVYIPMRTKKAEKVFRALLDGVFCHYGMPYGMTVVSDNGTEFKNELQDEMAKYMGYRKIAVLPWNPKANGLAEATVKRIKGVLERHTNRYRDWHKLLPLAQYLLNTSFHHGIKDAPFTVLFGREAPQIPELENPILRSDANAPPYVRSLRERIDSLRAHIKAESDQLRSLRRLKANATVPELSINIHVGDTVFMLYRNKEEAARIRKSGQGNPWRHTYRVIALKDYSVQLAPLDGSPALLGSGWQPLHKVSKSPPEFIDDRFDYVFDAFGLTFAPGQVADPVDEIPPANPFDTPELDGAPPDDDGHYEVEEIIKAEKRGGRWNLLVKWRGWSEANWEPRKEFLEECGEDVRKMARQAVAAAVLKHRGHTIMDGESSSEEEDPDVNDDSSPALAGSFLILARSAAARCGESMMLSDNEIRHVKEFGRLFRCLN